jgi:predicted dehydrogenase
MIRLALIGADWKSREFAAVACRIRGASFRAVCDSSGEQAASAATAIGAELTAGGLAELLESHRDDFDAVVAPWDTADSKEFTAAARAGKHILLEATGTEATDAADELSATARDAGVRLVIGRPLRFLPSMQTIRNTIAAGQLGRPGLVRVHRWKHADHTSPTVAVALAPDIDLTCWLFDAQPEVVFATRSETAESTGNLLVHLGFPSGGMAMLDLSEGLPEGGDYFSLSVIGSSGSAIADDHHNQQLIFSGGNPAAVRTDHAPLHRLGMLQDFVDSIVDERDTSDSVESVRCCERIVAAIQSSLESRQAVETGGIS